MKSLKLSASIKVFSIWVIILMLSGVVTSCSKGDVSSAATSFEMGSMDSMPGEVKAAPTTVQQAYQFAVANPEVLKKIPCYCGCEDLGHTSNYDCYISGVDSGGKVTYDSHALGCSICVDITQDTMRLMKQGMTVPEIKAYIDQTYSQYGPSNIP